MTGFDENTRLCGDLLAADVSVASRRLKLASR